MQDSTFTFKRPERQKDAGGQHSSSIPVTSSSYYNKGVLLDVSPAVFPAHTFWPLAVYVADVQDFTPSSAGLRPRGNEWQVGSFLLLFPQVSCSVRFHFYLHTWVCVVSNRRYRERRFLGGNSKL